MSYNIPYDYTENVYSEHELNFRESVGSECKQVIYFALDGLERNINRKGTSNIW
ncbi:28773_t:CDS:1, partial [Racocetra persica]